MKRIHLLLAAVLLFAAVPLLAARRDTNVVDDVIRMQKAGVAEDEIVAFVHKGEARFDVTADDMIALHDAGVSRNVIKAILDEADNRGERRDSDRYRGRSYAYSYSAPPVYYGYWGVPYYYDPFYSPYYYDPFWYGPRISVGFGFGFGGYWGGYRGYRPIFRGGFRHHH